MRTGALGPRLAAALLLAWGGLGPHQARAQADQGQPAAPPVVRDDAPTGPSLSEQLDRSKGVIVPPAIDREHRPGDREAGPEHRREVDAGDPAPGDARRGPERAAEVTGIAGGARPREESLASPA